MSRYVPDCWVVVRIQSKDYPPIDKVLAGWYGGFGGSDSWKLSSGIIDTLEFDERFEFTNHSGSVYICYKNAQKMSGYVSGIYNSWVEQQNDYLKIEIIKY